METERHTETQLEIQSRAEAAWEELMVARNAETGTKTERNLEMFQDQIGIRAEMDKCRIPQPRVFFASYVPWQEEELVAGIKQGLWEVDGGLILLARDDSRSRDHREKGGLSV